MSEIGHNRALNDIAAIGIGRRRRKRALPDLAAQPVVRVSYLSTSNLPVLDCSKCKATTRVVGLCKADSYRVVIALFLPVAEQTSSEPHCYAGADWGADWSECARNNQIICSTTGNSRGLSKSVVNADGGCMRTD